MTTRIELLCDTTRSVLHVIVASFHSIVASNTMLRVVSLRHGSLFVVHLLQEISQRISRKRHNSGAVHWTSTCIPTYAMMVELGVKMRGGTAVKETKNDDWLHANFLLSLKFVINRHKNCIISWSHVKSVPPFFCVANSCKESFN